MQTCEPLPGCGVLLNEGEQNPNGQPWSYVGEKKGGYEKVETLIWVGEGQGSFDRAPDQLPGVGRGCIRKLCLCFLFFGVIAGVVCLVYSLISRASPWSKQSTPDYSVVTPPAPGAVSYTTVAPVVFPSSSVMMPYTTQHQAPAAPVAPVGPFHPVAPVTPARAAPAPAPVAPAPPSNPHASDICHSTPPGSMSAPQKMWCCANKGVACPKLDCNLGYKNWENGWSVGKQLWCCKHDNRGCHDQMVAGPAKSMAAAAGPPVVPAAQASNIGKPLYYDCMAGFSHWQEAWPDKKKQWCCSHYKRGCS